MPVGAGGRSRAPRSAAFRAIIAAVLIAVAGTFALDLAGTLATAEDASVDARYRLRGPSPTDELLVVAIDDVTFSDLGIQWPFPRSLHGRVIDRLRSAGARRVVVDIQFTEETSLREDMALYRAVVRAGGVVLATTEVDEDGRTRVLGGDDNLRRAGARAAASSLPTEGGGVIRRVPREVSGLESLAVAVAGIDGGPALAPELFAGGGALIDYRGPPGTIPTVSYSDVLEGRVPASRIRGRIVVVGASAPSLQDVHATPTSDGLMSGPEVQANAIWTAVHGVPLRDAPGPVGILAVMLLGAVGPVLTRRLRPVRAAVLGIAIGAAYAVLAVLAFDRGTVVPLVAPLLACVVGVVAGVVASHLAETRERRRVSDLNDELGRLVRERTRELHETQVEIIRRLSRAAESRDEDTGLHIERMSRMCEALGRAVGMSVEEAERLRMASALHDVGKIGIPDAVLLKPGRLDDAEVATMREHTLIGAEILAASPSPLIRLAEEIAMTHHERWDGSGYPHGLAGDEIPLAGRIAAVCDVFDALMAVRPYKRPWTLEEAAAELRALSGSHFDPRLVPVFLELVPGLVRELELVPADIPVPATLAR